MKNIRLWLAAVALSIGLGAQAQTTLNAIDNVLTNGSYSTFSDIGTIRTDVGNDHLRFIAWNIDTLAPGEDQWLIGSKRVSNDQAGYVLFFDDGANKVCFGYAAAEDVCHAFTPTINVWYLTFTAYDDATDTWTVSTYTVGAGSALVESDTLTPTTSLADDAATQEVTMGGGEAGGTVSGELDGQYQLAGMIGGTDSPTPNIATFAADPLNTGDLWKVAYTTNFRVWLDSTITCPAGVCTDASGNGETLTLNGSTTLGSGNGPTVPDRVVPVPPTFDTGVAWVSSTTTAMTVSFNGSADSDTYYCAVYATGATPTAAQVKAGTGDLGTLATGAATGSSQNVAITAAATVHPFYEPHCVLEDEDGLSAVSDVSGSLAATPMAPPATCGEDGITQCQFVDITSIGTDSPCEALNNSSSPDMVSGDVIVAPITTDDGVPLTVSPSCQFSYFEALDRQSALNVKVFDASAVGYHADDIDAWFNNRAPACIEDFNYNFTVGVPASTDVTVYCPDEDDAPADLTISVTAGTHVTGISFSDPTLSGTATVVDESSAVTFQALDIPGDVDSVIMTELVLEFGGGGGGLFLGWVGVPLMGDDEGGPEDVEVPDVVGLSLAAADTALEMVGLDTGTTSAVCSAEAANEVLEQDPLAGAFVELAALVDLEYSSGVECTYSLVGIPAGWYSIPNVLADQDFVALMRTEATTGGADWAYYLPGVPQGTANLRLDMIIIRAEAQGAAEWARWAPGTQPGNTGNLQLNMQLALNADFQ